MTIGQVHIWKMLKAGFEILKLSLLSSDTYLVTCVNNRVQHHDCLEARSESVRCYPQLCDWQRLAPPMTTGLVLASSMAIQIGYKHFCF